MTVLYLQCWILLHAESAPPPTNTLAPRLCKAVIQLGTNLTEQWETRPSHCIQQLARLVGVPEHRVVEIGRLAT